MIKAIANKDPPNICMIKAIANKETPNIYMTLRTLGANLSTLPRKLGWNAPTLGKGKIICKLSLKVQENSKITLGK